MNFVPERLSDADAVIPAQAGIQENHCVRQGRLLQNRWRGGIPFPQARSELDSSFRWNDETRARSKLEV